MAADIREIDGNTFFYGILAGTGALVSNLRELNEINVFPVADADTGTNLVSTFRTVISRVRPDSSYATTAKAVADAALDGARGCSGIIFAQFLQGLATGEDGRSINAGTFSRLVRRAADLAREALAQPVEGTVITVMRDWAEAVEQVSRRTDDIGLLIVESLPAARRSLEGTTAKLEALQKAGVVDAGGTGFVLFLEGVADLVQRGNLRRVLRLHGRRRAVVPEIPVYRAGGTGRYGIEALVEGEGLDAGLLRRRLARHDDAVVVAGSGRSVRVHVQTEHPARLFRELRSLGTVVHHKVTDTLRGFQAAHARAAEIALVTDSTCDLPQEILDRYQIHLVPVQILVGQTAFLDRVAISPEDFYGMLLDRSERTSTSQPGVKSFEELYAFLSEHYRSVVALHLSSKLSGTWGCSLRAAEEVSARTGTRITVIDSRTISGGMGLVLIRTARALEAGAGHDELVGLVEGWLAESRVMVSVMTLKYLVRSGRLSPLKGALARLLNLKPVLSIDGGGALVPFERAFSAAANRRKVMRHVEELVVGRPLWGYAVVHAHDDQAAGWYAARMERLTGRPPEFISNISPAIGVHVGRGAAAVALLAE